MAPRGRLEGVRRIITLMRRLEGTHYAPSLKALAADYQVSERTIRRDLELLEEVGVRVPDFRRR